MCVIFTLRKTQFGGKSTCVTACISRGSVGAGWVAAGSGAPAWALSPAFGFCSLCRSPGPRPCLILTGLTCLSNRHFLSTGASRWGSETRAPCKSIVEWLPRDDTNAEGARALAGAGVRVQDRQRPSKAWGREGCTAGPSVGG